MEPCSVDEAKHKKERKERALFTLQKRVKAGEVDPRVAKAVLKNYLKDEEMTEDTYFADKLREAQSVIDSMKGKTANTWVDNKEAEDK
jgi:hypothetical protein